MRRAARGRRRQRLGVDTPTAGNVVAEPSPVTPQDWGAGGADRRPYVALCRWLLGLWVALCLVARVTWRGTRRGSVALWRSLRPYGTASWRHPPRGA